MNNNKWKTWRFSLMFKIKPTESTMPLKYLQCHIVHTLEYTDKRAYEYSTKEFPNL